MLKLLRILLEIIFIALAINMGYPHAQQIWYNHNYGYWKAIVEEWGKAWQPMLANIIIVVVVIIIEYIFVRLEIRDIKKKDEKESKRWVALFKALGNNDPCENEEKPKQKGK